MSVVLLKQLFLYELLDIVPCALLADSAFHDKAYSKRRVAIAIVSLYVLGVVRRLLTESYPASSAPLSLLWDVLYLLAFRVTYRTKLPKLLFVLITVLNFGSLIAILYGYVGNVLFGQRLTTAPYGIYACLSLVLVWLVFFAPLYLFMRRKLQPVISSQSNEACWRFLWLVPATFCVFFYYNVYTSESVLAFSGNTRNFIFAMVISAGFIFVLFLVLRLARENDLMLQLEAENYHLSLQALQYKNLQERMEETRRARHDLRQCMAVIQFCLQSGDRDELQRFAARYCATLPPDTPILYCQNPAVNAILSYYGERAREEQIKFDVKIEYPSYEAIPDTDIVVLLGNLLENAVEACKRQTKTKRLIQLSIKPEGRATVMILDNSYEGASLPSTGSFYSSKRAGMGIGLTSIRQIAEKHGGAATFSGDGATFRASVLIMWSNRSPEAEALPSI